MNWLEAGALGDQTLNGKQFPIPRNSHDLEIKMGKLWQYSASTLIGKSKLAAGC